MKERPFLTVVARERQSKERNVRGEARADSRYMGTELGLYVAGLCGTLSD